MVVALGISGLYVLVNFGRIATDCLEGRQTADGFVSLFSFTSRG